VWQKSGTEGTPIYKMITTSALPVSLPPMPTQIEPLEYTRIPPIPTENIPVANDKAQDTDSLFLDLHLLQDVKSTNQNSIANILLIGAMSSITIIFLVVTIHWIRQRH